MQHHRDGPSLRVGFERQLRVHDFVEEPALRLRVDLGCPLTRDLCHQSCSLPADADDDARNELIPPDVSIEDAGRPA